MGIEYKISCDPAKVHLFDEFLRRSPFFESYEPKYKRYELRFRGVPKTDDFPDASVALEIDGINFCDNLTSKASAAMILRCIIDEALRHSDKITIEER